MARRLTLTALILLSSCSGYEVENGSIVINDNTAFFMPDITHNQYSEVEEYLVVGKPEIMDKLKQDYASMISKPYETVCVKVEGRVLSTDRDEYGDDGSYEIKQVLEFKKDPKILPTFN